jgi:hypothetical protein
MSTTKISSQVLTVTRYRLLRNGNPSWAYDTLEDAVRYGQTFTSRGKTFTVDEETYELAVGYAVTLPAFGRIRQGIVTKVGRSRVTVRFERNAQGERVAERTERAYLVSPIFQPVSTKLVWSSDEAEQRELSRKAGDAILAAAATEACAKGLHGVCHPSAHQPASDAEKARRRALVSEAVELVEKAQASAEASDTPLDRIASALDRELGEELDELLPAEVEALVADVELVATQENVAPELAAGILAARLRPADGHPGYVKRYVAALLA